VEPPFVPESSKMRFRVRLRTRWSDEDNMSVLNNAVHNTLLEEARFAYFSELGLLEGNVFPFVLLQTSIRFLNPGRGGCEVMVEMVTTRLGSKSFTQSYRIRALEGSEIWCEAEAVLVSWGIEKKATRPIAAEFRRRVANYEGLEIT
jgi:acyl-CoA thioesterase FadM